MLLFFYTSRNFFLDIGSSKLLRTAKNISFSNFKLFFSWQMKRKIKIKILIVATVVKNIISSASSTKSQKLFFFSLHIQIFQTRLFLTPSTSSVFFRLRRFDDAVAVWLCVGVVGITRVDQVVCRRVLFAVQRRLLGVGLSSVVRRWRRRRRRRRIWILVGQSVETWIVT